MALDTGLGNAYRQRMAMDRQGTGDHRDAIAEEKTMSMHYADRSRAADPYSLPNIETFKAHYADCPECGATVQSWDCTTGACGDDGRIVRLTSTGWFYWFCFPGCLPDCGPSGPFATEADALADARDGCDDDEVTA